MKKIFFLLLFISAAFLMRAQFPVNSTLGSKNTTVLTRGIHAADSAFRWVTNYPDTATANFGGLKYIPGSAILVDNKILIRNQTATGWISQGGGSYTFTNGLTESGGTVKLGGALVNNTSITNPSGYSFDIHLNEDNDMQGLIGDTYNSFIGFANGSTLMSASNGNSSITLGNPIEIVSSGATTSSINVSRDNVSIYPNNGKLYLDSLNTVSSTTGRKVLVHDTATGKVERVDPANLGLNYADSLRRSGLAVQMRKNGSWTTQFNLPDSAGSGWGINGNTGTNPTTNFLGTTDNQPMIFKTNNTERLRIFGNGNIGIGTTVDAGYKLDVNGGLYIATNARIMGEIRNFASITSFGGGTFVNGDYSFYRGDGIGINFTIDATNNTTASKLFLKNGNATLSSKTSVIEIHNNDATAQKWQFGTIGTNHLRIRNETTGTNVINVTASNNIGINSDPDNSAVLDVTSTTQGFLPPRMTTTQRDAITSPAAGLIIYNTTTSKHQGYNGTTWNDFY
jgi:hypothetical protein